MPDVTTKQLDCLIPILGVSDFADALHAEFTGCGVTIPKAPADMPWGVREFSLSDPDGHTIRFSTSTSRYQTRPTQGDEP